MISYAPRREPACSDTVLWADYTRIADHSGGAAAGSRSVDENHEGREGNRRPRRESEFVIVFVSFDLFVSSMLRAVVKLPLNASSFSILTRVRVRLGP